MAKILVIVLGLVVAYWLLKRYSKSLSREDGERPGGGEDMVRCVKCGLHLPKSESIVVRSEHFCSPEHAHERERRGE